MTLLFTQCIVNRCAASICSGCTFERIKLELSQPYMAASRGSTSIDDTILRSLLPTVSAMSRAARGRPMLRELSEYSLSLSGCCNHSATIHATRSGSFSETNSPARTSSTTYDEFASYRPGTLKVSSMGRPTLMPSAMDPGPAFVTRQSEAHMYS